MFDMSVQHTSHSEALTRTLNEAIARANSKAVEQFAEHWSAAIPSDALHGDAQRAGIYVRTSDQSTYAEAVNAVQNLFRQGLEEFFAGGLRALFAGNLGDLFADDPAELLRPNILPEASAPGANEAVVASATGWAQPEHFYTAIGSFDFQEAYSQLAQDWLSLAGVR